MNKNKIQTFSVVIPAFNEEKRLPPYLQSILNFSKSNPILSEIIIVDDASTDNTLQVVANFANEYPIIKILKNERNHGKGYSIKKGMLSISSDGAAYADADGATPISELEKFIDALNAGADVAIAYRTKEKSKRNKLRAILGKIFFKLVNLLILPDIKDSQCGFKAFTRDAISLLFPHCHEEKWCLDIEILLIAKKKNLKIVQIPIEWHEQPGSKLNLLRDSLNMLLTLFKLKIRHRNIK